PCLRMSCRVGVTQRTRKLIVMRVALISFFFFNDTATTEIYTLSLHDALPISHTHTHTHTTLTSTTHTAINLRSEEHTSELQSHLNLVCRLLLEKNTINIHYIRQLYLRRCLALYAPHL